MIELEKIVERVSRRIDELGISATAVSKQATGSADTIRNWIRAVEKDRATGSQNASATTIKLNQIEAALEIELTRTVDEQGSTPETRLRAALLAYGVDREDIGRAVSAVKVFVDVPVEPPSRDLPHGQSELSNRLRVKAPSQR